MRDDTKTAGATTALAKITAHDFDARPVQNSASFQGLTAAMVAPVVVPLIASWFGMADADATLLVQHVITAGGALWALYGILRRTDIRLPWQRGQAENNKP